MADPNPYIKLTFITFIGFIAPICIFVNPERAFYVLFGINIILIAWWILLKLSEHLNYKKKEGFWDEHLKRVSKQDINLFFLYKLGKYESINEFDMYIHQAINKIEELGKDAYTFGNDIGACFTIKVDIGDCLVDIWIDGGYSDYSAYKLKHKFSGKEVNKHALPSLTKQQKDILKKYVGEPLTYRYSSAP